MGARLVRRGACGLLIASILVSGCAANASETAAPAVPDRSGDGSVVVETATDASTISEVDGLDEKLAFYATTALVEVDFDLAASTVTIRRVLASMGSIAAEDIQGRELRVELRPEVADLLVREPTTPVVGGLSEFSSFFSLVAAVGADGTLTPSFWQSSFDELTASITGSGSERMGELIRLVDAGELPSTTPAIDPAEQWLAAPPENRSLDIGSSPEKILEQFATVITISVVIPEGLRAPSGGIVDEGDITSLRIYQPDFADVVSIALLAGGYVGPVAVPEGPLFAQFIHLASGKRSQPLPLGPIRQLTASATGEDVVTIRVEDAGYREDGSNLDALSVSVLTATPEEWPAEIRNVPASEGGG